MYEVEKFSQLKGQEAYILSDLFRKGGLTYQQKNRYLHICIQDQEETPERPDFTEEEKSYRRGYAHGFIWARLSLDVEAKEVIEWANGHEETCPPGTPMAGMKLPGLVKKASFADFSKFMSA